MPSMSHVIVGLVLFGAVFGFGGAGLWFTNPEAHDIVNNYEHQMTRASDIKTYCRATKDSNWFFSNAPDLEADDCASLRSAINGNSDYAGYTVSEKTYVFYSYISPVDGVRYHGKHEQKTYHDGRVIKIGDPLSIFASKTDHAKTRNGKIY